MNDMNAVITEQLRKIEHEEEIIILYACESGSRSWGFSSPDSDYDVRFLYVRPVDWYLSIFEKRDVIERPISDRLDINGWDLKKALNLFRKSNPPLLEWLESPIQYLEHTSAAEQIRGLSPLTFSPKSCLYHYLNMAKGNYRDYLQGEQVKIKKYFYVLRPILACLWIEKYDSMPPIQFESLVESLVPRDSELCSEIYQLIQRKKSGEELTLEPRLPLINDYLEKQIKYYDAAAQRMQNSSLDRVSDEELDHLFRSILKEAWHKEVE